MGSISPRGGCRSFRGARNGEEEEQPVERYQIWKERRQIRSHQHQPHQRSRGRRRRKNTASTEPGRRRSGHAANQTRRRRTETRPRDAGQRRDGHQTRQILQSLNEIAVGKEGNEVGKWRRGRRSWEGAAYKDSAAGEGGRRADIFAFLREPARSNHRRRNSPGRRRREPSLRETRPNLVCFPACRREKEVCTAAAWLPGGQEISNTSNCS